MSRRISNIILWPVLFLGFLGWLQLWQNTSFTPFFSSTTLKMTTTTTTTEANNTRQQPPRAKFVPFPHQNLGTGDEGAGCTWTTKPITNDDNDIDETTGIPYDTIQRAAFSQGICLPHSNHTHKLHVFSRAQAIECLSPVMQGGRNITVAISGDSYNRQLFIGLADILLGRPWNIEILNSKMRSKLTDQTNLELLEHHRNDSTFPNVQYVCSEDCYGMKKSLAKACSSCINHYTKGNPNAVAVVGAFVHIHGRLHGNLTAVLNEIWGFLDNSPQVIFNSGPSYETSKVPVQYRNASHHQKGEAFYNQILPHMAPYDEQRPFLDFFQLTRACYMEHCSYDGGHRSRYVNRWKAQLLLNTICTMEADNKQADVAS
jgi:hypothetical protein